MEEACVRHLSTNYSACVYIVWVRYMCVRGMQLCVCLNSPGSQRKMASALLYHSLSCFFEMGSLTEPCARLAGWWPAIPISPPVSVPHISGVTSICHTWLFISTGAELQTQVFMLTSAPIP